MIDANDYESLYHELKNYISFLNTTLQLHELRYEELLSDDPQWHQTKKISKRIMNISNVLPLCDLASDFFPVQTNMNSFFQSYLHTYEATYETEESQLFVSLEDGIPDMMIDPAQLRMALNQLVTNALEATEYGSDIYIKAFLEQDALKITIKDFGPGIPEDQFDKIFQPGFTTKADALGLGLSLADTAVQLLGGTISAANNPSCGVTFTLSIPVTSGTE